MDSSTKNTNFVVGTVHSKVSQGWICQNAEGGSITFEIKGIRSICIFLQQKSGNGKGSVVINGVPFVIIRAISDDADGGACENYGEFAAASAARSASLVCAFAGELAR